VILRTPSPQNPTPQHVPALDPEGIAASSRIVRTRPNRRYLHSGGDNGEVLALSAPSLRAETPQGPIGPGRMPVSCLSKRMKAEFSLLLPSLGPDEKVVDTDSSHLDGPALLA